ncbi:MAG: Gfo/Idh/MocA family oxidoreductase [Bdellovibrionales bacterium]|nr:Gfo/Idh/MocA family oxidoreductase [Bdellovibrionales bacterium]
MRAKQIRYGVVGVGHIAQVAMLPAFTRARKNSILTALVTGDPKKASKVARKYNVHAVYDYDQFDDLLTSDVVDALYIALPNDQHKEFTVRALRHGIHVLCEKPLALSEADCKEMEEAAKFSGAKLMTAYRLHFEESNLKALELCKRGKLGDLRYFSSCFSYQVTDPENIRLQREAGGGPLWDIGIYCINAARTLFQAEPIEVFAMAEYGKDKRFAEVEETVTATMRFPDKRLATFTCSFGSDTSGVYEIYGTKGGLRLENAFEYVNERKLYLTKDAKVSKTMRFKKVDQFAPELDYFSDCILKDREPEPSGREGANDVRVIEALYRSIKSRKAVALKPTRHGGPSEDMAKHFRPHSEPSVVNANSPHN